MLDALAAAGPHPDDAEKLMLFGQFVGSWDFEGFYLAADDDARHEVTGEWHFGWVLEGRAIQDVLVCPPRGRGRAIEYGSTVRFYDPQLDAWQITWISPPQRAVVRLVARPAGEDIVLEGEGSRGLLRWTFTDIAPETFTWRGYESRDGGGGWQHREEMRLRRRQPG